MRAMVAPAAMLAVRAALAVPRGKLRTPVKVALRRSRLVGSEDPQGREDRVTCHAFVLGDGAEDGDEGPEPDWVVVGNCYSLVGWF